MANNDLQFILRFKSEASGVLTAARQQLAALAKEATAASTALQKLNSATGTFKTNMAGSANAAQQAQLAQQKLANQSQRLALETQRLAQQQQGLALNADKLALSKSRLELQQSRLNRQWSQGSAGVKGFSGALLGATRAFLPLTAAAAAYGSINMIDSFTVLRGRISLVTESTEEFNKVFAGLRQTSKETGTEMNVTVGIFQRLSFVRKEIKASANEMLQFTDTVAKLGVVSGATPEAMKDGLTQLGQSLSSNLVRAEEFNSIMENVPAIGKSIADELGVTTGQLRLLVVNGKLLSSDVFAAMLNATKKVNDEFAKMPMTVSRAFKGLLVDLQASLGKMNEQLHVTDMLIWMIQKLANAFKIAANFVEVFSATVKITFSSLLVDAQAAAQGIADAFSWAVNKAISFNNMLPGLPQIAPVSFDVTNERFFSSSIEVDKKNLEDLMTKMDEGNKLFGELFGTYTPSAEAASVATRKISQDYAKLAEGLTNKLDPALARAAKRRAEFYKSMDDQISQLKEETFYVGQSAKARERSTALLKIQQEAMKAGVKNFNPAEYMKAYDDLHAAQEKVHKDFTTGLKSAMTDFQENMKGAGDLAADMFNKAAENISGTIKGLVDGSINSFSDLKASIGNILADISGQIMEFVIQQSIIQPLMKSLFGVTALGGPLAGQTVMPTFSAKGNVFDNGSKVTFMAKGDVINSPMTFPMRSGVGVAGEAGPEAIMPLKRLSNGDLGVQTTGGAGGMTQINYSPTFAISTSGGGAASGGSSSNDQLFKELDQAVRKTVLEVISREQRPGGALAGGKSRTA